MYVVTQYRYDFFTGRDDRTYYFETVLEAWNFYVTQKQFDFEYRDHYSIISRPRYFNNDAIQLPVQRPHARSYEEYVALKLSQSDPLEELFAQTDCSGPCIEPRDVETPVQLPEEDEYIFDRDEIEF